MSPPCPPSLFRTLAASLAPRLVRPSVQAVQRARAPLRARARRESFVRPRRRRLCACRRRGVACTSGGCVR
eukprot:343231-Pleurochrysis_carterae.AAC.1